MLTKYMTSAAVAALLLTSSVAFAQENNEREHAAPRAGAEQRGPAAETPRAPEPHAQPAAPRKRAEEAAPKPRETPAGGAEHEHAAPAKAAEDKPNAAPERRNNAEGAGHENGAKPNERATTGQANEHNAERNNEHNNAAREPNGGANEHDNAPAHSDHAPHDQHASVAEAKNVKLDPQRQTRITDVIRNQHVENITKVDFDVRVGGRVPDHYHVLPIPEDIVSIVPEYRGYDYLVADDDVIILDPESHEIVYTLPEGGPDAMNRRAVDCK
ncbi:MAG: DUF1236 domain-containing protein [Beijerinckiaceae bacterium]|nr:DUF1236 domain-containing protein [Beijerinckiaceae bacterium]